MLLVIAVALLTMRVLTVVNVLFTPNAPAPIAVKLGYVGADADPVAMIFLILPNSVPSVEPGPAPTVIP